MRLISSDTGRWPIQWSRNASIKSWLAAGTVTPLLIRTVVPLPGTVLDEHDVPLPQWRERAAQMRDRGLLEPRDELTLPVDRRLAAADVIPVPDLDAQGFRYVGREQPCAVDRRSVDVHRQAVELVEAEQMHARRLAGASQGGSATVGCESSGMIDRLRARGQHRGRRDREGAKDHS